MSFDLTSYLDSKKEIIDRELITFVNSFNSDFATLKESILYSINAGGKRLRPILCLASCEALGQDSIKAVPVACALEMIHTYSLIHDDLPCMDDDSYRRGKPTNHKVYGEATAILAGDALLTDAFHLLSKSIIDSGISADTGLRIIEDISRAAGLEGMIGGQALDLSLEGKEDISVGIVEKMHGLKTGALLGCSVMVGARIGGAGDEQLESFKKIGNCMGLAYQIIDDVLDIEGSENLGKETGADIKKNKVTYPSVVGIENAKNKVEQLLSTALYELDKFGTDAQPLISITKYLGSRKN
ncbi:MAG: polyprenyl synthetase family protein [Candidatus Dadabacteria bacterium]|nr:polyprenyl synthetase family protein [Candidatus Dadabacteria bacterium]